jgi:hypothetical protein
MYKSVLGKINKLQNKIENKKNKKFHVPGGGLIFNNSCTVNFNNNI